MTLRLLPESQLPKGVEDRRLARKENGVMSGAGVRFVGADFPMT